MCKGMTFQRSKYDACTYERRQTENTSTLGWIFDGARFENPKKCMHQLGLLGGPTASHVSGNLVDMESELMGITRHATTCTTHHPKPLVEGAVLTNDKTAPISTHKRHLPACQMIAYRSVPLPPPMEAMRCRRG